MCRREASQHGPRTDLGSDLTMEEVVGLERIRDQLGAEKGAQGRGGVGAKTMKEGEMWRRGHVRAIVWSRKH